MCGVAGFIDFKHKTVDSVLLKMTGRLVHRGPDGYGLFLVQSNRAHIGLGHRRLSIIDLSTAAIMPKFGKS